MFALVVTFSKVGVVACISFTITAEFFYVFIDDIFAISLPTVITKTECHVRKCFHPIFSIADSRKVACRLQGCNII